MENPPERMVVKSTNRAETTPILPAEDNTDQKAGVRIPHGIKVLESSDFAGNFHYKFLGGSKLTQT